ncbi:MAG: PilZ domain-containing protein [Clostridiales bacterium]|nr:PilZ domain-containing protein [Clostridiales bacterium]
MDYELKSKIEVFSTENDLIGNAMLMDYSADSLYITVPMINGMIRNLKPGREIKIVYYTKQKIYGFYSVIKSEIIDNVILYKIDIPQNFHVVQRRKFVRIPVILDIKYVTLSSDELVSSDLTLYEDIERIYGKRINKCMAVDLSGEGMAMVVKEELSIGTRMIIVVENSQINVVVSGSVRRREKLQNSEYDYKIGIQFIDISGAIKEKIIQYIFKKMRNQLKSYSR